MKNAKRWGLALLLSAIIAVLYTIYSCGLRLDTSTWTLTTYPWITGQDIILSFVATMLITFIPFMLLAQFTAAPTALVDNAGQQPTVSGPETVGAATKLQHVETGKQMAGDAQPAARTQTATATSTPRLEALLAKFSSAKSARDNYAFIRDHSQDEIAQVCASIPIHCNRLEHFESLLAFASILTGYPEALKAYADFGLPKRLDHQYLAGILMPRLMVFIEALPDWMKSMRLQDQPNPLPNLVQQRIITERLYDFAMKLLVNDYPREALICLRVHELQPVKPDGKFWIFGSLCNIAANEQDQAAVQEGIRVGKELMASNIPADAINSVEFRLKCLSELSSP